MGLPTKPAKELGQTVLVDFGKALGLSSVSFF